MPQLHFPFLKIQNFDTVLKKKICEKSANVSKKAKTDQTVVFVANHVTIEVKVDDLESH